jgi:hypothetical protein
MGAHTAFHVTFTTVTATVTGAATGKLFLIVEVTQAP